MPVNPFLIGVTKTLLVNGQFVLASRAGQNIDMETEAKNYMQGTIKNRIMNIGGLSEDIIVEAPVLIGGAKGVDGRALLNNRIDNMLINPSTTQLPLLKSGKLSITADGASANLNLWGDGNPNVTKVFEVAAYSADQISDSRGNTNVLDPLGALGPTRVARFFDFRLRFGRFTSFILEASIIVEVDIQKNYFIGGYDGSSTSDSVTQNIEKNWGTQFPTLTASGLRISGSGKAAVQLKDINGDRDFADYGTEGSFDNDESINLAYGVGQSPVTLQTPGVVVYDGTNATNGFIIEVYDPTQGGGAWVNLISSQINLSRAVVKRSNFNVEPGLLTNEFEFQAWVK